MFDKIHTTIGVLSIVFILGIYVMYRKTTDNNIEPFEKPKDIHQLATENNQPLSDYISQLNSKEIQKKIKQLYTLRPLLIQAKFSGIFLGQVSDWNWTTDYVVDYVGKELISMNDESKQDAVDYLIDELIKYKNEDYLNLYRTPEIIQSTTELYEYIDKYFKTKPEIENIQNALIKIHDTFSIIREMSHLDFELDNVDQLKKMQIKNENMKTKMRTIFASIMKNEQSPEYAITEEQMFYALSKRNYMEQEFMKMADKYYKLYDETSFTHYKKIADHMKGLSLKFNQKGRDAIHSLERAGVILNMKSKEKPNFFTSLNNMSPQLNTFMNKTMNKNKKNVFDDIRGNNVTNDKINVTPIQKSR